MKRRMTKKHSGKLIIITVSIIAMNFLGISYAYWTEDLGVNAQMTTSMGNINPSFCNQYSINKVKGDGDLSIRFEDDYTMIIEGQVEPGYKAFLDYNIVNKGTVPVKYENQKDNVHDGIKIVVNQKAGVLKPEQDCSDSDKGASKLQIEAKDEGNYRLDFELPFQQWISR